MRTILTVIAIFSALPGFAQTSPGPSQTAQIPMSQPAIDDPSGPGVSRAIDRLLSLPVKPVDPTHKTTTSAPKSQGAIPKPPGAGESIGKIPAAMTLPLSIPSTGQESATSNSNQEIEIAQRAMHHQSDQTTRPNGTESAKARNDESQEQSWLSQSIAYMRANKLALVGIAAVLVLALIIAASAQGKSRSGRR